MFIVVYSSSAAYSSPAYSSPTASFNDLMSVLLLKVLDFDKSNSFSSDFSMTNSLSNSFSFNFLLNSYLSDSSLSNSSSNSSLNSSSNSDVNIRSSSSISKTGELADELLEEFFLWLSSKWSCCVRLIQQARECFVRKEYELDELCRLTAIQLDQLNIDMRIYEIILENLNNSKWRKHARDFIKLQTAEDSTVSSTVKNSTVRNSMIRNSTVESSTVRSSTARSSTVKNDDDEL